MLPLLVAFLVLLSSIQAAPIAKRWSLPSQVNAAWYTDWRESYYTLSDVSWSKYNTMYYAFAGTTSNVSSVSLSSNGSLLTQFVSTAHAKGVAAHLCVGGWDGSAYFSTDVGTADNRTAFVSTIVDLVQQYNLDGINFDWEFPGSHQGNANNTVSGTDTANFLSFLQELRANPTGANITISAAVLTTPFDNAAGQPSTNLSGFAAVFDYIAVMDYNVWGSWDTVVGPNAPLNDSCVSSSYQKGSAVSAVNAWTNAGIPANQIVLAVPSSGQAYIVNSSDAFVSGTKTLAAYPNFDQNATTELAGTVDTTFAGLITGGFLNTNGTPAEGIYYRYDSCSQTPYVYNETSQIMISYDDADSFTAKGDFIRNNGLRGYAMYEAYGDYNNILIDAIGTASSPAMR